MDLTYEKKSLELQRLWVKKNAERKKGREIRGIRTQPAERKSDNTAAADLSSGQIEKSGVKVAEIKGKGVKPEKKPKEAVGGWKEGQKGNLQLQSTQCTKRCETRCSIMCNTIRGEFAPLCGKKENQ